MRAKRTRSVCRILRLVRVEKVANFRVELEREKRIRQVCGKVLLHVVLLLTLTHNVHLSLSFSF